MRARDIKGKKVVGIRQTLLETSSGEHVWSLDSIRFADGSVLALSVFELESGDGYGIDGIYCPKPKAAT